MSKAALLDAVVNAWESLLRADDSDEEESDDDMLDAEQLAVLAEMSQEMNSMVDNDPGAEWDSWSISDWCIESATKASAEHKCELTKEELDKATLFVRSLIVQQDGPHDELVSRQDGLTTSETELSIGVPHDSPYDFSMNTSVVAGYMRDEMLSMDLQFSVSTGKGELLKKKARFDQHSEQSKRTKSGDRAKWEAIAESCGLGSKFGIFLWHCVIHKLEGSQETQFGCFYPWISNI